MSGVIDIAKKGCGCGAGLMLLEQQYAAIGELVSNVLVMIVAFQPKLKSRAVKSRNYG